MKYDAAPADAGADDDFTGYVAALLETVDTVEGLADEATVQFSVYVDEDTAVDSGEDNEDDTGSSDGWRR